MVTRVLRALLERWHKTLGLPRDMPLKFHQDRLAEELQEVREAKTVIERLSETSDVLFTISRARYCGFPIREQPPLTLRLAPAYCYMIGKFTLRCGFYRTAGMLCGVPRSHPICEVVNPAKDSKFDAVASRYPVDPVKFRRVASRLRRVWPLLP